MLETRFYRRPLPYVTQFIKYDCINKCKQYANPRHARIAAGLPLPDTIRQTTAI